MPAVHKLLLNPSRRPEIRYEPRSELVAPGSGEQKQVARDVSATLEKAVALVHAERAFEPNLSWTHYRVLMRVEHAVERLFYKIEVARDRWSTTVLERQIHTHLFLRLQHACPAVLVRFQSLRGIGAGVRHH